MTLLRRVLMTFIVLFLVTSGAGSLWSTEISKVEGRPWDSGHVSMNGENKGRPVFDNNPSFRIVELGNGSGAREREDSSFQSFKIFLSDILSFLCY